MRVVDVTQWYAPTSGGIRTYLRAKARWARERGRLHGVVVPDVIPGEEMLESSRLVRVQGRTPTRSWGYRVAVSPRGVIAALERLEPSVVVLHDAMAFPRAVTRWASARGIPVVMLCHSDLSMAVRGMPAPVARPAATLLRWVQRRGTAAPDLVVVTSRVSEERLAAQVSGRVERIPLGIDLDVFAAARPDPVLRESLAPEDTPLLLYAGRLSREKRVDLLPDVLALLPGVTLVVAGAGQAAVDLRRRAIRLGVADRLVPLGHIADRRRLARLMATADCFVHPNPDEPYGLAPLEALAAGCRVVAPDSAGSRETLAGRGAILVPPTGAAALADGVATAFLSPRPRAEMADLSWDRTFAAEWRLYHELTEAA